jgi:CheY-like chemotaxis protein
MQTVLPKKVENLLQNISVLVVDDNAFMRKLIRGILTNLGVKGTHEASDGLAGIEAIRLWAPDIVVVDWEMPLLNGAEMVRIVRSPGVFPMPDVPIIMLTGHVERWRIVEATKLGVHEFLKKPVSGKALLDRMVSILANPRPMVRIGDYYGPEPRGALSDPAAEDARRQRVNELKAARLGQRASQVS